MAINFANIPQPVSRELSIQPAQTGASQGVPSGESFARQLGEFVHDVDASQKNAGVVSNEYAAGTRNDLHGSMIAMSQADISLRLLASVRNRVIEAYREIMRMGA